MDIKEFGQSVLEQVQSFSDRLLDWLFARIPEDKRRLFFIVAVGSVLVIICLAVVSMASSRRVPANFQAMIVGPVIPPEELFYPGEPDFLPPLLLERDPHPQWTNEDLEVFWQDPKAGNEEKWREAVKAAVDKLMEGVP